MTSVIVVRNLRKAFGAKPVLDGVSLDVSAGGFTALLGSSGAGKTTLLRCIARLTDADSGETIVMGRPMNALHGRALVEARRSLAFVFQQFNLVRRRSALENAVAGRLAATPLWRVVLGRVPTDDLADALDALDRVGLGDHVHARADQLSGGQQQRVAIARALVQRSEVLLADEPIASLDPKAAEGVLTLLKELTRERELTVLCSLHQHELARRFADDIVTLEAPDRSASS